MPKKTGPRRVRHKSKTLKDSMIITYTRFPQDTHNRLEAESRRRKVSMAHLLRELVEAQLQVVAA